ncbi:MAG TPA: hypothetical protein VNZ49_13905 [Bacteroidia bacterium]|jgi:hypothetical protein|nr:hypothetical protein [Bacteroidia bacterium]
MVLPKNAKLIEWTSSTMWFDEDGVLYSVPKAGAPQVQSKEETETQMKEFRKLVGDKKTCMILQTDSSAPPPKKEDRDWIAQELDSVTKAMGIISTSPLSRMVANLFFGLKPPAYPVKFFSNELEAKKWIKQYL